MSKDVNARLADTFGGGQQIGLNIEGQRVLVQPSANDYTSSEGGSFEQSDASIIVTLDDVFYRVKPQGSEYGAITKRLQQAGPTICTPTEFSNHVKCGGTWVGAVYEPSDSGWGNFIGQRLFGLDFDNATSRNGAKSPLSVGDEGYLDPVDALDRCEKLGFSPMLLYFTYSARCPDWPRFRLVFDIGEMVEEEMAKKILRAFLKAFPEADQACKNPNRLYLGSNGEVWECWRVFGDAA